MPQETTGRRWRWRPLPRMRLATMLVLIAVAGAPAGWYIRGVREQRQAVQALLDAGAAVAYDWEGRWEWGTGVPSRSQNHELAGWRRFLAERFGPDAVATVAAVSLMKIQGGGDRGATDEHIRLLGRFKSLQSLELGAFTLTEEGAAPIAGLKQLWNLTVYDFRIRSDPGPILARFGEDSRLERLSLIHAVLDDEDFTAIARLSRLETLRIAGGFRRTGDADLAKLSGLRRLKDLWLPETRITPEALKPIGRMKSLEAITLGPSSIDDLTPFLQLPMLKSLRLGDCKVGDEAISALGEMPALKSFSLTSNALTDAGLARLRNAPALEKLTLVGDSITPAGLEPLAGIKTLKRIQIRGSKIVPGSAAGFAKAHPGISIAY